ncbi:hypothetical protein DNTS_022137 [Danionella cerebrum]|uniref:Monocyte to macrophage differentiation factor n=1 Tax=Danionella cerebrum TaxID=2873325 RepID=A0A553R0M7_9TELE|nr:hypothetical protein DNTS_022137 [Danionella translucida]
MLTFTSNLRNEHLFFIIFLEARNMIKLDFQMTRRVSEFRDMFVAPVGDGVCTRGSYSSFHLSGQGFAQMSVDIDSHHDVLVACCENISSVCRGVEALDTCTGVFNEHAPLHHTITAAIISYLYLYLQLLIVPAFVGMALLHRLSDDRWQRITAWVYGMGLIALFLVSTVFHIITWKKSHMRTMEHCFHMCDRVVIYFFIAASYTPWLNLRELGPLAAHMRWFVWLMAAAGTFYVFKYHEKYKLVELAFYLTMGFFPALVVTSMSNTEGLYELAFGGFVYCLGVVFFKSDGVIPFAHAIWHIFVAMAAAIHYYAIWKYLYRSATLEDIRDA